MARPNKRNVEFFPHDVDQKTTLFILQKRYRNDGYALWYKTLELLGKTSGHYYDCSLTARWHFYLAYVDVNEDVAKEILELLSQLDGIDRDMWINSKIIWSKNFIDRIAIVYHRRNTGVPPKPNGHKIINENNNPFNANRNIDIGNNNQLMQTETDIVEEVEKVEEVEEDNANGLPTVNKPLEKMPPPENIYNIYEKNIGLIVPMVAEELKIIEDKYPFEWFEEAVKESASNNARSLKYIKSILQRWEKDGFKVDKRKKAKQEPKPKKYKEYDTAIAELNSRPGGF